MRICDLSTPLMTSYQLEILRVDISTKNWVVFSMQLTWFERHYPKTQKCTFPKILNGCFTLFSSSDKKLWRH